MSQDPSDFYRHRFEPGDGPGTLLLLHGTGRDENDLVPLAREVAPGWAILSPRGDVDENGMLRFFRRQGMGVFDPADLRSSALKLAEFAAAAAAHYGFSQDRLVALGLSNGANVAANALLLRPESLAGAALLRPMLTFEPEERRDLSGKRVLLASGTNDPMVPPENTERLADLLRSAGAEVRLLRQPAGHGLVRADLDEARRFLSEWGT